MLKNSKINNSNLSYQKKLTCAINEDNIRRNRKPISDK